MMTERVLSDFEGRWAIERTIQNVGSPNAVYTGTGLWEPHGDGLRYTETGELLIRGYPAMQTTRSYDWCAPLDVYFDDGRFFHSVPPAGGEARHWCDPDDYRVVYRFETWPRFEVVWRVIGPRKDYTMISRYRSVRLREQ